MGVLDDAVAVWHAARVADGKEPDGERIRRVRQKLEEPDALLVVVERAGGVVAMALAEPSVSGTARGRSSKAAVTSRWCSCIPAPKGKVWAASS